MADVLVVDDRQVNRDLVATLLGYHGHRVREAAGGEEALRGIRDDPPDLVITDVIMPGGMNGRELAEEVARQRPGTRVLFTSGYTEDAIVHHGRLDPGVALLNKPYRKKDLAEKLRQVIDAAA